MDSLATSCANIELSLCRRRGSAICPIEIELGNGEGGGRVDDLPPQWGFDDDGGGDDVTDTCFGYVDFVSRAQSISQFIHQGGAMFSREMSAKILE